MVVGEAEGLVVEEVGLRFQSRGRVWKLHVRAHPYRDGPEHPRKRPREQPAAASLRIGAEVPVGLRAHHGPVRVPGERDQARAEGYPFDDLIEAAGLAVEADQMDPGDRDRDHRQDRERRPRPARTPAGAALRGEHRQHRHRDHRVSHVDLAHQAGVRRDDREEQQVHPGERPEHALVVGERSPAGSRHREDGRREHRPGGQESEQEPGLRGVAVAAEHGFLEIVEAFEERREQEGRGSLGGARPQPPGEHAEQQGRERERVAAERAALAEHEPQ